MRVNVDLSQRSDRRFVAVFLLAVFNFMSFYAASMALGGEALNGWHGDGHYFLSDHGRLTEVSAAVFRYSQVHGISVFITHLSVFAAALPLLSAKTVQSSRTLEVAEIAIDEAGQLSIRPMEADESFQQLHRGPADVRWDPARGCFTCPKPGEWSSARLFRQARAVIGSDLGRTLEVTSRTTWTNVTDALREQISTAG